MSVFVANNVDGIVPVKFMQFVKNPFVVELPQIVVNAVLFNNKSAGISPVKFKQPLKK